MAYNTNRRASVGALFTAMTSALQWRLLLLWLVVMWVPTLAVALPMMKMLGGLLDHSVHSLEWAQHENAMMFGDVITQLYDNPGWIVGSLTLSVIITLLLSPFLTGMVIGTGRAGRALGFGALLQNGLIEYGRMFRLLLWSLVPFLIVIGVFAMGSKLAGKQAEHAVLESQADSASRILHWVVTVVFLLAHAVVESARAAFIADPTLRSATRAMGRGVKQLVRRPLATLLFYIAVTLVGLLLLALFGLPRLHNPSVLIGVILTQLITLSIGWMRIARLFALSEVARSLVPGNRRSHRE